MNGRRFVGVEAIALAALLAAEVAVFSRGLETRPSYDEGVYLASLDALRHGQGLGSDVFASQPPGFYVLLRLAGWIGGDSITGIRVVFVGVALLGCLGAFALGRALAGPIAGLLASGLLAITPPFPSEAPRVEADVPSVALATAALACLALAWRRRGAGNPWLVVLGGAALGAAVSVKLLALTALAPFVALAVGRRRSLRRLGAAAVGAAAVWAALLIGYAGSLGSLWDDAVDFHRDSRHVPSPVPNGHVLRDFLDFHTPSAWLLVLGAAASLVAFRRVWPLWTWTAVAVAFLLWQQPLFEHHLVLLSAAAALPAGTALGALARGWRGVGVAVAGAAASGVLAAGLYQQGHRLDLAQTPEQPSLLWATRELERCTAPRQLVASDQPIVAFRARRRTPGQLVDTSLVRLSTSSLPPERVLALLRANRVAAVVAGRSFLRYPTLLAGLEARYGAPRVSAGVRVYARC